MKETGDVAAAIAISGQIGNAAGMTEPALPAALVAGLAPDRAACADADADADAHIRTLFVG